VDGRTVTFVDGSTFDADVIVMATGYRQTFPFLHARDPPATAAKEAAPAANEGRRVGDGWLHATGARGAEDPLPSEHFIVSPEEPTLAFVGFVRPNVGAIPPMAELQVFWWIQRLRGHVTRSDERPSYGLLGKKLTYGVVRRGTGRTTAALAPPPRLR
jgi:dimethylaniline monooxygenase (N-oxide forming)